MTHEQLVTLKALAEWGVPYKEIAALMNSHPSTVNQEAIGMGIRRGPKRHSYKRRGYGKRKVKAR